METVVRDGTSQVLLRHKSGEKAKRRTKYDVWSQILESCLVTRRTRFWLLSRLNLSSAALDKALSFLKTAKLIKAKKVAGEKIKYMTTLKGKEAVEAYYFLVKNYYSM